MLLAHATEIEFRQILRKTDWDKGEGEKKAFHVPSFRFPDTKTNATTRSNLKLGT